MQKMLTLLTEAVDVVFNDLPPNTTDVLSQNLYREDSLYQEGEMPYFWLLLGHQESMWPLTASLGLERAAKLPFASAYFFEFLSAGGADYVGVQYRDDQGNMNEVHLECSKETGVEGFSELCEVGAFRGFI